MANETVLIFGGVGWAKRGETETLLNVIQVIIVKDLPLVYRLVQTELL